MDFALTEEQVMLKESLSKFVSEKYPMDRYQQSDYSCSGTDPLKELGLADYIFGNQVEADKLKWCDIVLTAKEVGRKCADSLAYRQTVQASVIVNKYLNQDQISHLIDKKIGLALVEGRSFYDLAKVSLTATKTEKGYVLNGIKKLVASIEENNLIIVSARTSGDILDESGISLFLLNSNHRGLKKETYTMLDGGICCDLFFNQVVVEADTLLGEEGKAYKDLKKVDQLACLWLCAASAGAMDSAIQDTIDYLKQRKQFGKALSSFQALQHKVADCLIHKEEAESMTFAAAMTAESDDEVMIEKRVSAAKILTTRAAKIVSETVIQLHGAIGMTDECSIGRYSKYLINNSFLSGDYYFHLDNYEKNLLEL